MLYTPPPRDPKQPPIRINLLSDTQTRPTPAMREAMARAEVGDEQIGDDPTVNLLCERVADLLGKEAAVFMPSGTMCNVAATLVHCRPGDEILAHETAHIIAREGGAHAALGGFQITPLPGADGKFSPETFRERAASAQPLPAAADRRQRRADRQYRRRHDLEEGRARRGRGDRQGQRPRHPYGRRAAAERLRRHRHQRARDGGGLGFRLDRFLQGTRRADRRRASRARAPSSTRSGAGSSGSAARCARPASAPPPASMRSTIMSTGSPTITPMPARWRAGCRRSRASRCRQPETNLVFFKPDGAGVSGDKMVAALAQARRAARDDGRPHPRLHASRRDGRDDRGDGRTRCGRSCAERSGRDEPGESLTRASASIDQLLHRLSACRPRCDRRLHHADREHIVAADR